MQAREAGAPLGRGLMGQERGPYRYVELQGARLATGLPCPGCGMTRAWVFALHGEVSAALAANPFVVVLLPAAVALVIAMAAAGVRRRPPPDVPPCCRVCRYDWSWPRGSGTTLSVRSPSLPGEPPSGTFGLGAPRGRATLRSAKPRHPRDTPVVGGSMRVPNHVAGLSARGCQCPKYRRLHRRPRQAPVGAATHQAA